MPLVGLALIVVSLVGCRSHHDGPRGGWDAARVERRVMFHLDERLDDLDASEAQREVIQQQVRGLLPRLEEGRKRREALRDALLAELEKPAPDKEQVHGLVEAEVVWLDGVTDELAASLVQLHGALTPEQRAALAEEVPEGRRFERRWMVDAVVERWLDRLDASAVQAERVMSHKDALLTEVESLAETRQALRGRLLKLWAQETLDEAAVQEALQEGVASLGRLGHLAADAAVEIAPTLTPRQREVIFKEFAARRR